MENLRGTLDRFLRGTVQTVQTFQAVQAPTRSDLNHRVVYATTATTTVLIVLLAYSRRCYLEWYALGEGGVPRSPLGWLMNVAAHLVARRDHRAVPAPYERLVAPPATPPPSSKPTSKPTSTSTSTTTPAPTPAPAPAPTAIVSPPSSVVGSSSSSSRTKSKSKSKSKSKPKSKSKSKSKHSREPEPETEPEPEPEPEPESEPESEPEPKPKPRVEGPIIKLSAREEERYGEYSRTSFFSSSSGSSHISSRAALPIRSPPRPTVPTTVLPQRQTTETASGPTLAAQDAYLRAIATANPRLFAIQPSALESPKFNALWVVPSPNVSSGSGSEKEKEKEKGEDKDSRSKSTRKSSRRSKAEITIDPASVPWFPRSARGEVAHVHHEGSTHVVLSLVDAAHVVRQGWGERHKMSGVGDFLPWGYVLVYALRDGRREDWMVWREIVLAGARVNAKCAGFEGEVVVP
ncbi:hypothetical protein F5Y10DRAFT_243400 [Nemania abortiva]|nr:hypothetical protein F5Y10DRAFT_243400 [Nemania abortiva]